jgi:hypothetical protein
MKMLAIALLLLAPRQEKAEDLLKAAKDRIGAARTLRVQYTLGINSGGVTQGTITGTTLIKGADRWRIELVAKSERGRGAENLSRNRSGRTNCAPHPGSNLQAVRTRRRFENAFQAKEVFRIFRFENLISRSHVCTGELLVRPLQMSKFVGRFSQPEMNEWVA